MLFYRTLIVLFFQLFVSCHTLRCTTNCSFTLKLTIPFNIPNKCNQIVLAERCLAAVDFSYDRGEYDVYLQIYSTNSKFIIDNRRFVFLRFLSNGSSILSYSIERICNHEDDCARNSITNLANEILQRQYNYSAIMNELKPLIVGPSLTPDDLYLKCYDSNQTIQQCGTLSKPESCSIFNIMSQSKTFIGCNYDWTINNAYIQIYQRDGNFSSFDIYCNRSLCNTYSTAQAAKQLMFKHRITVTSIGLLYNSTSKLIISTVFIIMMMIFIVLYNRV